MGFSLQSLFGQLPGASVGGGSGQNQGSLFGDRATGIGGLLGGGIGSASNIVGLTNASDKAKGSMTAVSGFANMLTGAQGLGNFITKKDKSVSDGFGAGGSLFGGLGGITDLIGGSMAAKGNDKGSGGLAAASGILGALGGISNMVGGGMSAVKALKKDPTTGKRDWKGALKGGLGALSGLAGVAGGVFGTIGGIQQAKTGNENKTMSNLANGFGLGGNLLGMGGSLIDVISPDAAPSAPVPAVSPNVAPSAPVPAVSP